MSGVLLHSVSENGNEPTSHNDNNDDENDDGGVNILDDDENGDGEDGENNNGDDMISIQKHTDIQTNNRTNALSQRKRILLLLLGM